MKRRALRCLVAMASFFLCSGSAAAEPDTIVVGTELDYPPYSFASPDGDPSGFNADIVHAIAAAMGVEIELEIAPWTQIRSALERGEIDAIVGMFVSDAREADVDFTPGIAIISHAVFVRAEMEEPESIEELRDAELVVMRNDIMHDYVTEAGLGSVVHVEETIGDVMIALESGLGEYALAARLPGLHWINELGLKDIRSGAVTVQPREYAIAVPDGDAELLALFTEGLAILERTGELHEIYVQRLGILEGQPREIIRRLLRIVIAVVAAIVILAGGWISTLRREVRRRTADLRQESEERARANARLEHVNRVLASIRNVNQLITHESREEELLKQAVELLSETRGYHNAWILRRDPERGDSGATQLYEAGSDAETSRRLRGTIARGSVPRCVRSALDGPGIVVTVNPRRECQTCPMRGDYDDRGGLAVGLRHGGRSFGALSVSMEKRYVGDTEEQQLFSEVAGDLAFSLDRIRLERAEAKLQSSLELASLIIEQSPAILFRWSPAPGWRATYVSDNIRRFGYAPEELTGDVLAFEALVHPDDVDRIRGELTEAIESGASQIQQDYRLRDASGEYRWVDDRTTIHRTADGSPSYFQGVVIDVQELRSTATQLELAVEDRETLLRELYHRTKNNMQVIASLIALRRNLVEDWRVEETLRGIESKIHAMALVHDLLHRSEDLSRIRLDNYLQQLVDEIAASVPGEFEMTFSLEPVSSVLDLAVPLGLVANELITNAVMHAFPPESGIEAQQIHTAIRIEDGTIVLTIEDTGVGLPAGAGQRGDTLGLQIVESIVKSQLGGELELSSNEGTRWTVRVAQSSYAIRL